MKWLPLFLQCQISEDKINAFGFGKTVPFGCVPPREFSVSKIRKFTFREMVHRWRPIQIGQQCEFSQAVFAHSGAAKATKLKHEKLRADLVEVLCLHLNRLHGTEYRLNSGEYH